MDQQFQLLMQQVIAGSEEAAEILFRRYEHLLICAIRQRLNKKVRAQFDSIDIAQDVWKSFFAEPLEERTFPTPDDLVVFLTTLARNKVIEVIRQRMRAKKHNVNGERSIDSLSFDKDALAGNHPTPSQIVMSREEWTLFLRKQPLVYQRIFILMREGLSHQEIASQMAISTKMVQRVMDRLPKETAS